MIYTDLPGDTTRKDFTQFVHGLKNDAVITDASYDRLYFAGCIEGQGDANYIDDEDGGEFCNGIRCSLTAKDFTFACQMAS